MKVLYLINSLAGGGAQKLLADIVPLMCENKNIEIDVLVLSEKNNVFHDKLINGKVKVFYSDVNHLYNPRHILTIRNIIKRNNYDVVHVHLFPSIYWTSLAIRLLSRFKRPKLIMTEHNTHNRRRDKIYFKFIEKYMYKKYDKVISITDDTQINLLHWLEQKKSKKYSVIENGIELKRYMTAKPYNKNELNDKFNEGTPLLCMVGSFTKQKDQKTIIDALSELDDSIHLLLIGEGELKEDYIQLAKKKEVKNRVHFMGFRNDVERIMKTVDIIILSSHWEGFGLVAAEGMAAGKPVIASDVEGLRDVVSDAGVLFEQGDKTQLSLKINKLLNDEEYYQKVSDQCLEKSKLYDINNLVKNYLNEYIN